MKKFLNKLFDVIMRILLFFISLLLFFGIFGEAIIGVIVPVHNLSYAEAIQMISEKQVESITLYSNDDDAELYQKGDEITRYIVNIPNQEAFCEYVQANISTGDTLEIKKLTKLGFWQKVIFFILGFCGIRVAFRKSANNKDKKPFENPVEQLNSKVNFSKKILKTNIMFSDVAGLKEEKEEVAEIIEFLKNPQKFIKMGAKVPKGILLSGPPGTGKTLLAKATAGEAGVSFLAISGSDFDEVYVGVGASRVRELFDTAKKIAPCIIFIDELDAVGQKRTNSESRWSTQTIEQLLVAMDGFDSQSNVIVIAATNRPDALDPALTRPGRFDRIIEIHLPDINEREEILKIHGKNKKFMDDVSFTIIAHNTSGFSGAELENLLNEAAILAVRKNQVAITTEDIDEALRKVSIGIQKKGRRISYEEKLLTAYHEAGHAVVSKFLSTQDTVKEVSIIPRGTAGGYTWREIVEDKSYISKTELTEKMIVLMGGRAAEKIALGDISTGASSDLRIATRIAQDMICVYGMNEEVGPIAITNSNHLAMFGSQTIGKVILETVKNAESQAYTILSNNRVLLEMVTNQLLSHETISGTELDKIFKTYKSYTTE